METTIRVASTLKGSASGRTSGPKPRTVTCTRSHMSPLEPLSPSFPFTEFVWRMNLTSDPLSGAVHSRTQERWSLPSVV